MTDIGAIAGLAAAACWALASLLYSRVPIGAGAMATWKNCLATICMAAALWAWGVWYDEPMFQASATSWRYLGLSGIIGLCIADIAYFRSLQILGPRKGLTLTLLTPVVTAILGQVTLNESLSLSTWLAILVTLMGIGIVMRERVEQTPQQQIRPGSEKWGVICAVLGVAAMAVGSVLLKRGTEDVNSIEATFIRLFAAAVSGVILSTATGHVSEMRTLMQNRRSVTELSAATILGTVLGVWLMLVCYQHCTTGTAATLTSTTPLFIIPIARFVYGQTITPMAVTGAAIAFCGVCVLLLT